MVYKESYELIAVKEWVDLKVKLPFIHIPNEGVRNLRMGNLLKKMGMRSGVSDIFMPKSSRNYHGLWIEFKTGKGKVSNYQQAFIDEMNSLGYCACAC